VRIKRPDCAEKPEDNRAWGYFLKKARHEQGLYAHHVANIFNVSCSRIYSWEAMSEPPALKYIPQLIEFLGYVPWCRTPYQKTLGESVRAGRELKGLTQRQLGEMTDICTATIIKIENNQGNIRPFILKRLQQTLKISLLNT